MNILDKLIWLSEGACLIIFWRRRMTLSARAIETARLRGDKSSRASRIIDRLFWFDPNHCHNAYVQYRFDRLNRSRKDA